MNKEEFQELLNKYRTNCFSYTWNTKKDISIKISKEDFHNFSKEDVENGDKIMYLIEEETEGETFFYNGSYSIYLFEDFQLTIYW